MKCLHEVLALDPSSTKTGYCVWAGGRGGKVQEAGVLRPGKVRDPAAVRIRAMGQELVALLTEMRPAVILIEVSMSSHGRAGAAGARTLHVYGMAVGYLWALCQVHEVMAAAGGATVRVELVDANDWTRGIQKRRRTAYVAGTVKGYDAARDGGGDAADAIGMARWWAAGRGHHRGTETQRR